MKKLSALKILSVVVILVLLLLAVFINTQGTPDLHTLNKQEHIALYESEDNGFLLFMEAYDLLEMRTVDMQDELSNFKEHDAIDDELRNLLDKNVPALEKLREGLSKPKSIAPYVDAQNQNTGVKQLSRLREMGRQLAYRAQLDRIDGNIDAALNGYLDVVRLGGLDPKRGFLITGLVGVAIQGLGTNPLGGPLGEIIPELNHEQLKHLIKTLEAEEKLTLSIEQTIANDHRAFVVTFSDKYRYWVTRKSLEVVHDRTNDAFKKRDAELRIVILQARIELYTREQGEAPANLEAVMGGRSIPIDPFSGEAINFVNGQPYSAGLENMFNKNTNKKRPRSQ